MRRLAALLFVPLASGILTPRVAGAIPIVAAPAMAADGSAWIRPVDGGVLRAFDAPSTPYGPGHRGVDLATDHGEGVRAAGAGVVEYAGTVAGTRHVVILHDNGWRTSYSYLAELLVSEHRRVRAGEVIARCCYEPADVVDGHHGGLLHFGLRVGDEYVDPMLLFSASDLTELVHLAPAHGSEWPSQPRSAIRMVLDTVGLGATFHLGGTLLGSGGQLFDGLGGVLAAGAQSLPALDDYLASLSPLAALGALDIGCCLGFDVGRGILGWIDEQDECDHDPPSLGTIAGATNRLMFVAGINSERSAGGSSNDFPAGRLGYEAADTRWFSYSSEGGAAGGGAYVAADTLAPIDDSARRLAGQLRAMQREQPGRSVDLIAHSQGGVVVQTFLKFFYDSGDPSMPPLGTVVTIASPHQGAPLATSAAIANSNPILAPLLSELPGSSLPADAASVRDLSESSEHNARLHRVALPPGLDVISIGAPLDWVVPATATDLDGAEQVTVAPDSILGQHSDLTTDDATLFAIRNALVGRPAPCVSLSTSILAQVAPRRIAFVERIPGALSTSPFALL